jgi:hypothetical protein
MFDVFYSGPKPNLFAFEKPAQDLDDAAAQCRTGYYWYIYGNNDYTNFDFDYRPVPWESTHVHVWPTQWNQYGGAYLAHADSVRERKWQFHHTVVETKASLENWAPSKYSVDFDFTWVPHPMDPPYIYVFGNQWYPAEVMPTVEYHVPGASERKFMNYPVAQLAEHHNNKWNTLVDCEWDYSWVPDPGDTPYIYVFGNQWYPAEVMPTVRYTVPGATEIKYMDYPRAVLLQDKLLWTIPEEVNADTVDYSWVPDPGSPPYIYHFGTDYQQSIGLTYTVPGATELKFAGPIPTVGQVNAVEVLDIFFIDRGNDTAQARYERLAEDYTVTKVRYANSMMNTIKRCVTRSRTNKFWVISSEYNYNEFDFAWHAEPWQNYMTHVFASQHNKWSDTFLINRYEFERHAKWAKSLEEFPNLNFVPDQRVVKPENIWNMYYIDHGNPESQYEMLRNHYDVVKTRFMDNYLDTFKRIMNTATTEYVWILNSVCTYDFFDFTWQPEPWQKEMIHCFVNGSVAGKNNAELRGDTFYIHVESFKKQMVELELLDWFNVINYVFDQRVERWPVPAVYYKGDNLIEAIKAHTFTSSYAMFTNDPNLAGMGNFNTCLWTEKDRVARDLSTDRSTSMIPRDIKKYLKTQVYDYPYLEPSKVRNVRFTPDLDIVYISNGEPDEERWYEHACYQSNRDVKWIRGVNGRVAAYQAAARASESNWFFAVFAKLEVLGSEFDWHWQPDYWQEPKHYIFNARNPVNGLEYGHMGMIAYNKRLVLANNAPGIDFTLSQPHESVPVLSGIAHFNQDAWTTWRTAFREVLKLRLFMATQPTLETEHRLNTWLTVAQGNYSNYCIDGANDAVAYYDEVAGDPAKLQLSFEWAWLRARYDAKY